MIIAHLYFLYFGLFFKSLVYKIYEAPMESGIELIFPANGRFLYPCTNSCVVLVMPYLVTAIFHSQQYLYNITNSWHWVVAVETYVSQAKIVD